MVVVLEEVVRRCGCGEGGCCEGGGGCRFGGGGCSQNKDSKRITAN